MDEKDILDKIDDLKVDIQIIALDSNTNQNNIINLKENIEKLETKVDDLSTTLAAQNVAIIAGVKAEFVKYVEFEPIKTIVYGIVGIVLISVMVALMALVIIPQIQANPLAPGNQLKPGPAVSMSHGH